MAATALLGIAETANAGVLRSISQPATPYYPGSYPGPTGYLDPAKPSEPWVYGSKVPIKNATGASTTDVGWGSPGVSLGLTAYNGPGSAMDFEIIFGNTLAGVPAMLDIAQIAQGAAMGCTGSAGGGTVFCGPTGPGGALGQWGVASYTANSISFVGPPGTDMQEGQKYFVNVMLLAGSGGAAFYQEWTGTPEPSTWAMMLMGFAGLGLAGWRKARPAAPVA